MSVLELARRDWVDITSNKEGFGVDINLTTPDDQVSIDIVGLHTKHHLGIDEDGAPINSKNTHASFSEKQLTDLSYPCRINGEVDLYGHKVTVKDSTGLDKTYKIAEAFADETVGYIVCILSDYDATT